MGEVIISHRQDIDGIFAAAIFLIKHPRARVYFTNYGKDEMRRLEEIIRSEAARRTRGLIVVSDFNLNESLAEGVVQGIEFATSRGWRFVYLDHHEWSPGLRKRVDSVAELVINKRKCASELVRERFARNSPVARSLADLAAWADFSKPGLGLGPPLGDLIAYYNYLKNGESKLVELARLLAKGAIWSVGLNADWRRFANEQKRAKRQLIESTRTFKVGRWKLALAEMADFLQTSTACQSVLEFSRADLVAVYTLSGKVSFRRREGNPTPLNDVARALNPAGGGHAFAAGSFLGRKVKDSRSALRAEREILAAFAKVLE